MIEERPLKILKTLVHGEICLEINQDTGSVRLSIYRKASDTYKYLKIEPYELEHIENIFNIAKMETLEFVAKG